MNKPAELPEDRPVAIESPLYTPPLALKLVTNVWGEFELQPTEHVIVPPSYATISL